MKSQGISFQTKSRHPVIIFDWIFFNLAGNKDNHKSSDGFEIQPDQTSDCGVSCPCASGKIPIDL